LSTLILNSALVVTTVLAAPRSGYGLADRVQRRAARSHLSHPMTPAEGAELMTDAITNVTHVQYSSNWAGAVITSPPSGQTFNKVVGTFNVPTPKAPSGGSGSYSASAWVGIDGDTYGNAILQSGIDFTVSGGQVSYDAWYEWYPNYAYDFSGISMSAGDEIKVTISATTLAKGTVTLENTTTGKSVSKSLSAPSSSSHLGGQNAEWIVEDFDSGGSEVSFANFGTVTFTGCSASTASSSEGLGSASVIDIKQSSTVLTSVTIASTSELKVAYV